MSLRTAVKMAGMLYRKSQTPAQAAFSSDGSVHKALPCVVPDTAINWAEIRHYLSKYMLIKVTWKIELLPLKMVSLLRLS